MEPPGRYPFHEHRLAPTRPPVVAPRSFADARAKRALTKMIASAATRLVRLWGLVSLPAVIHRVRVVAPEAPTRETASAALAGVPGLIWLDDRLDDLLDDRRASAAVWFSLPDPRSHLAIAIGKVFSITPRVPLDDLRRVLAKALPGTKDAPARVLVRYLTDVAGCAIDDVRRAPEVPAEPFVRATARTRRHRPSRRELAVVRLLAADGGALDVEMLRQAAQAASLPRTTVNQILASSPLLLPAPTRTRVRVIGDGQLAAHA